MSHTEQETASEAMKRHFASRVSNQARVIFDRWRSLENRALSQQTIHELILGVEKLMRHAQRFNAPQHEQLAKTLVTLLKLLHSNKGKGTLEQLSQLNTHMLKLGQNALRHTDEGSADNLPKIRPAVLLVNPTLGNKLTEQLSHFSINNIMVTSESHFYDVLGKHDIALFIAEVDFLQKNHGIELMQALHDTDNALLPKIFISESGDATLQQRLEASRAGGIRFLSQPQVPQIIRAVERFYNPQPEEPYKVLVVDDSRSQAIYTEKALVAAGMQAKVILEPMEMLDTLESFQPEIIVMDMYMPGCTGTELAAVIRQQPEYLRIPIIFLSGEEDLEIQLNAMSHGGDDFLTKPVDPGHLATTIQNRGQRARVLNNLIVRDSLTGLYNHTHILDQLYQSCRLAKQEQAPLCFAMVDIDFFKKINDNYGHPVGDKVIAALSLFLKQRLRRTDSIGRYGGEEFAVILKNTNGRDALHVMNEIRQVFSQLVHSTGDTEFTVSFSCGVCEFNGENADFIIEYADQALYEAKRQGRNNVQLFVEDDNAE
ncbi:diguanylate cyclase [Bermanella sp. R86510]|uniref:GGDEF domain-containing response regulator n=1 Tax=unclassified Bermanella TaxID=2627862 RepID=UPI0037C6C803